VDEQLMGSSTRQRAGTQRPVKTFFAKHKITVLEHPPYSPDLATCDYFQRSSALKGSLLSAAMVKGCVCRLPTQR